MRTINEYKNRFYNLLESTVGNVKPLINENEDPYLDLYGKTVTYKDSQSGVELKGTIIGMTMIEPNYIMIVHNPLYVTNQNSMGYVKKERILVIRQVCNITRIMFVKLKCFL
jgi:hypothetical protein